MTEHSEETIREYDRIAKHYDRRLGIYARRIIEATVAMADLKGTETVLDTCCGTGELLQLIALREHRGALVGIDFSASMLNVAMHRLQNYPYVSLKHGDIHGTGLPSDYFHIVFNTNAFHYLDRPDLVLKEIYRVLRPHGRLIIADLAAHSRLTVLWSKLRQLFRPHYYRLYRMDELTELLAAADFIVTRKKVWRASLFWAGLVIEAQKPAPSLKRPTIVPE